MLNYFLTDNASLYYTNEFIKIDIKCICLIQQYNAVIYESPITPIVFDYYAYVSVAAVSSSTNRLFRLMEEQSPSTVSFSLASFNPNLVSLTYSIIGEVIKPKPECIFSLDSNLGIITISNDLNCVGTYRAVIEVTDGNGFTAIINVVIIVNAIVIKEFELYKDNALVDSDFFTNGTFSFEAYDLGNVEENPFYRINIKLDNLLDNNIFIDKNVTSTNPNFIINYVKTDTDISPTTLTITFQMLGISGESIISFVARDENGIENTLFFLISISNIYP